MPKVKEYQTTFLVGAKGSTHVVAAPTLRQGLALFLSALRSIGDNTVPTFIGTMVKRSIFLNGSERVISQVRVSEKMLDKAFRTL